MPWRSEHRCPREATPEQWQAIITATVAARPIRYSKGKKCKACGVPVLDQIKVPTCHRCRVLSEAEA